MIYFPHAKINLGLQVIEKREDGFHNIVTGLFPIGWCDILEIIEKPELSFRTSGLKIPGDDRDNLCIKAYHLVKMQFDIPPVYIHLHKVVPIGAGLGGGSSDAVFTLKALNQIFELGISPDQLKQMAGELGSDCAFFIKGVPALATGIGDQLAKIDIAPPGKYLVVVTPPVKVDTGLAYKLLSPRKPDIDLKEALNSHRDQWSELITNDFEGPIFEKYPAIKQIKQILLEAGATYACMSGSGSSVFGFFDKEQDFDNWFGTDHQVWVQSFSSV